MFASLRRRGLPLGLIGFAGAVGGVAWIRPSLLIDGLLATIASATAVIATAVAVIALCGRAFWFFGLVPRLAVALRDLGLTTWGGAGYVAAAAVLVGSFSVADTDGNLGVVVGLTGLGLGLTMFTAAAWLHRSPR